MSLTTGFTWTYKDISLTGYSIAGVTTSVIFPAADICFDIGQGLPFQVPVRNIAITHGHLDHAGGLPYLLGQKAMHNMPEPYIFMPEAMVDPMEKILKIWAEIENHTYRYQFFALNPGDERELKNKYFIKSFPTYHRVTSQGYTVHLRKKRLRPEFQKLSQNQLASARRQGQMIEEHYTEPIVSFTGDTKIEVLEYSEVRSSRILVMECTYWDHRKSIQQARDWGHIHLDEIIPRLDELTCEKLVLIHSSARYRNEYLQQILNERIPEKHRQRVEIFPREP